jgi:Na+-translocating ferredoxin:NAD+ oxidoreductase RnfG subunit
MKKNTKVTIAVALIGLVATAAVAYKYVNARVKIKELEAVSRLQNLTLIAIGNKDYVLACKSQTEAEQYLGKVHSKAEDLLGMIHKSNQDLCEKATKTQSK